MDSKKIQEKIQETFIKAFGNTPLSKRLEDIEGEARELCKFTDINNLKEETGDLLSTTIMLANEAGWDIDELIQNTLNKIERRLDQYKTLGRKNNIAILGGAFNPITIGHIETAKTVLNVSRWADEVWLMPANKHMHGKDILPFEQRYEMCKLACQTDGRIKVSDYEYVNNLQGETYHLLNMMLHDDKFENNRSKNVIKTSYRFIKS